MNKKIISFVLVTVFMLSIGLSNLFAGPNVIDATQGGKRLNWGESKRALGAQGYDSVRRKSGVNKRNYYANKKANARVTGKKAYKKAKKQVKKTKAAKNTRSNYQKKLKRK